MQGMLMRFKKTLIEQALGAEPGQHLGYKDWGDYRDTETQVERESA